MTADYLPKTWIKSVANECGISCETIEQLLDFAERVQRAAWLAASIPTAQAAPSEPVAPSGYAYRYHDSIRFNNGGEVNGSRPIEAVPYWFAAPPPPAAPAVAPLSELAARQQSLPADLRTAMQAEAFDLYEGEAAPAVAVEPSEPTRELAALCGRLVLRLRKFAPDDDLAQRAGDMLKEQRYLHPMRITKGQA
jgi:hypothetical protein